MGERWTDETREDVARVLRDADTEGWLTGPHGVLAPYYQGIADSVLTILADAGLLLPPGGEVREEHATVKDRRRPWEFVYRTTAEAARHTAAVWGSGAYVVVRTETCWPDGAVLVGPWREVTDASE